jgi:ribonuclease E
MSVAVGGAARLVGKKVSAHVERVLDGVAYATLAGVEAEAAASVPITAEAQAEKPTRASRARKPEAPVIEPEAEPESEAESEAELEPVADETGEPSEAGVPTEAAPKKKSRRGSRGGRNRRKKPVVTVDGAPGAIDSQETVLEAEPGATSPLGDGSGDQPPKKKTRRGSRGGRGRKKPGAVAAETNGQAETPPAELPTPTIHVPSAEADEETGAANGDEPATPKKKTRRGSRGGRRRRKPAGAASGETTEAGSPEAGSDQT